MPPSASRLPPIWPPFIRKAGRSTHHSRFPVAAAAGVTFAQDSGLCLRPCRCEAEWRWSVRLKFACFVHPHPGGTYSVFLNMRAGLRRDVVDLRGIALGQPATQQGPGAALSHGASVVPEAASGERDQAVAVGEVLESERVDGGFVSVLAERRRCMSEESGHSVAARRRG